MYIFFIYIYYIMEEDDELDIELLKTKIKMLKERLKKNEK